MKGTKREDVAFEKIVGYQLINVVAVNPDLKTLERINYPLGDDPKEPEYLKEKEIDGENVKQVRIDFYVKGINKVGTKAGDEVINKKSFFLSDINRMNKDKDKYQYINQVGESGWAADEDSLFESMTNFTKKEDGEFVNIGKKKIRIAKQGEDKLIAFIKTWLKFDYYNPHTDILYDVNNLFKGKFKELQEAVGEEYTQEMIGVFTIRTTDEGKQYQSIWDTFLPGSMMAKLKSTTFSTGNIRRWMSEKRDKNTNPGGRTLKAWEKLAIEMTEGEYRCKDYFKLEPASVYDESKNPITSNAAVLPDGEDADDQDDDSSY